MGDPGMCIRAGEPDCLSGLERGGTWRIPLNIEPKVEWRRQFLRIAHADRLFGDRKIAVQCAALIVELDGASLSATRTKIANWIAQANGEFTSESPAPSPQLGAATILVVDDQPDIGPLAKDMLELAGHAVIHTTDPLEALRWARQSTVTMDLLLLDAVMPVMGGRELARHILALRPTLKVILMSGYEVKDVHESGWPFLQKPFAMTTLNETAATELSRPSPPVPRRTCRPQSRNGLMP
jgi:CheY-like chemotaxis protein